MYVRVVRKGTGRSSHQSPVLPTIEDTGRPDALQWEKLGWGCREAETEEVSVSSGGAAKMYRRTVQRAGESKGRSAKYGLTVLFLNLPVQDMLS